MPTDREYKDIKRRIDRHIVWWVEYLGLNHWNRLTEYHRNGIPGIANEPGTSTNMQIHANADYMHFHIEVDVPSVFRTLDNHGDGTPEDEDRNLERMIVHELCHALVCELRPIDEEKREWKEWLFLEERVVAQLTMAFMWVANHGQERPRKVDEMKRKKVADAEKVKAA